MSAPAHQSSNSVHTGRSFVPRAGTGLAECRYSKLQCSETVTLPPRFGCYNSLGTARPALVTSSRGGRPRSPSIFRSARRLPAGAKPFRTSPSIRTVTSIGGSFAAVDVIEGGC